jgi:hypothetical protein
LRFYGRARRTDPVIFGSLSLQSPAWTFAPRGTGGDAYELKIPMPRMLSAIGPRHKDYQEDGWHI